MGVAKLLAFRSSPRGRSTAQEPDRRITQIRSISDSYLEWQFNYPIDPVD